MLSDRQVEVIQALRKSKYFGLTDAAQGLYMHRNSVVYHINKIKAQTGHDPQTFDGMKALLEMMEAQHGHS